MAYKDTPPQDVMGQTAGNADTLSVLTIKEGVAERLRIWRKQVMKKGLREYSESIHLNESQLKKYENKKLPIMPGALTLISMANTGLNVHWVLTGVGRMNVTLDQSKLADTETELELGLKLREIEALLSKLEPHNRLQFVNAMLKNVTDAVAVQHMEQRINQLRDQG